MKIIILLLILLGGTMSVLATDIYNFEATSIDGDSISFEQFKGKVILIVNTASKCGFTGQYEGLEKLYQEYKDKGLVILGFPANNFMKQEPGTNEEIKQFCTTTYNVTFPMFSKIDVKGNNIHPLYEYLTSNEAGHDFGGKITWNFNKFLVSKEGKVINRFGSRTTPENPQIVEAIEAALE